MFLGLVIEMNSDCMEGGHHRIPVTIQNPEILQNCFNPSNLPKGGKINPLV